MGVGGPQQVQRERERTRSLSAGVAMNRQREREVERAEDRDRVNTGRRVDVGGDDLNEGMRLLRARSERGAAISGSDASKSTSHYQARGKGDVRRTGA